MKKYEIWTENDKNEELENDYNLIEGDEIKLHYSNSKTWADHIRGKEVASMIDTGDNLIINVNGVEKIELDYQQAYQLLTLLIFENRKWKNEIKESITIKQF